MTKLAPVAIEKPWGRTQLPPPFEAVTGARVGEIWFPAPASVVMPILAKYLFTSEALSIQVHPSDEQARARGLAAGKEECWYILDAEPGAMLAIGTIRPLAPEALRDAALSGEIEPLMQWHAVEPGMLFHIPPGTIHAIGGRISLIEIQQNSDVTYRLYGYGRPRDLHLEEGMAVADAKPFPPTQRTIVDPGRSARLLETPHFNLVQIVDGDLGPLVGRSGAMLVIPLAGSALVDATRAAAGECLLARPTEKLEASLPSRLLVAQSVGSKPPAAKQMAPVANDGFTGSPRSNRL